ncbi:DUF3892 domain-containing protein [bacterium]|nr:DUF3892 domain-containing protein [bacterium]
MTNDLKAPIDIKKNPIRFSSEYAEPRKSKKGGIVPHHGIDLAPEPRTDVPIDILSMQNGTVIKKGCQIGSDGKGYGNFVVVQNADGTGYLYAHLNSVSVSVGDSIGAGDAIGDMGDTGSYARHLHIEKITSQGITAIRKDNSTHSIGLGGGTEGLKYRIDITQELLTSFKNLASDYARRFGKEFDPPLDMDAHTVQQTKVVMDIIKKFLRSLFDTKSNLTGIQKDNQKKTVMYQIDGKEWVAVATAIQMVKDGKLNGVIVNNSKGTTFLRTRPDMTVVNNLV